MTAEDDLRTVRRYTRQEAAAMLNIKDSWLKEWVSQRRVPHQRKGEVKGVWFTYADVIATGRMLTDLMTKRRANERARTDRVDDTAQALERAGGTGPELADAEAGGAGADRDVPVAIPPAVDEDTLARFRALRTARGAD